MQIGTEGSTLLLRGSFDARNTREVRGAIHDHLEGHDGDVVIDLTGVEFVDVPALRVLAVATQQARRRGHTLTLRGCNDAVRRLLHLTQLIRVVELEQDATAT